MTEQDALVALNAIPGLGSGRIRKLVDHLGSARQFFKLSRKDLAGGFLFSENALKKICEFDRDIFLQNEYNLIHSHQARVVTFYDAEYPEHLKNIPGAPVVLYIKGTLPAEPGLAIVGSRQASIYGLTTAEKFSGRLAELGIVVVSGMARGIDTASHRGCLRAGGNTVAVLGSGLADIYPLENADLFKQIAEQGCVVSEFPMATPPVAFNFPARNRIISGLSWAVLVIEATLTSGSLITADFALEQGKEVFAVPGKIDDPRAQGTNRLIKQGAKIITSFDDILEELKPQLRASPPQEESQNVLDEKGLAPEEAAVAAALGREPLHIDDVVLKSRRPLPEVTVILLTLELKRRVKQLPGKYFVRA